MANQQSRRISLVLLLAGVLVLGWFVWPTRYSYDHLPLNKSVYSVRTDRFTGLTEMLTPGGWVEIGGQPSNASRDLPTAEVSKLTATATWRGDIIELDIYNGTSYQVTEVTANVMTWPATSPTSPSTSKGLTDSGLDQPITITPDDVRRFRERVERAYRFTPKVGYECSPLEKGRFTASVLGDLPANTEWSCTIQSAKGVPRQQE
jgi:hypothetical protein